MKLLQLLLLLGGSGVLAMPMIKLEGKLIRINKSIQISSDSYLLELAENKKTIFVTANLREGYWSINVKETTFDFTFPQCFAILTTDGCFFLTNSKYFDTCQELIFDKPENAIIDATYIPSKMIESDNNKFYLNLSFSHVMDTSANFPSSKSFYWFRIPAYKRGFDNKYTAHFSASYEDVFVAEVVRGPTLDTKTLNIPNVVNGYTQNCIEIMKILINCKFEQRTLILSTPVENVSQLELHSLQRTIANNQTVWSLYHIYQIDKSSLNVKVTPGSCKTSLPWYWIRVAIRTAVCKKFYEQVAVFNEVGDSTVLIAQIDHHKKVIYLPRNKNPTLGDWDAVTAKLGKIFASSTHTLQAKFITHSIPMMVGEELNIQVISHIVSSPKGWRQIKSANMVRKNGDLLQFQFNNIEKNECTSLKPIKEVKSFALNFQKKNYQTNDANRQALTLSGERMIKFKNDMKISKFISADMNGRTSEAPKGKLHWIQVVLYEKSNENENKSTVTFTSGWESLFVGRLMENNSIVVYEYNPRIIQDVDEIESFCNRGLSNVKMSLLLREFVEAQPIHVETLKQTLFSQAESKQVQVAQICKNISKSTYNPEQMPISKTSNEINARIYESNSTDGKWTFPGSQLEEGKGDRKDETQKPEQHKLRYGKSISIQFENLLKEECEIFQAQYWFRTGRLQGTDTGFTLALDNVGQSTVFIGRMDFLKSLFYIRTKDQHIGEISEAVENILFREFLFIKVVHADEINTKLLNYDKSVRLQDLGGWQTIRLIGKNQEDENSFFFELVFKSLEPYAGRDELPLV